MSSSVYVAGLGVISAIGNNVAEHLVSFEQERAGMGDITLFNSIHTKQLPVAEVKLDNRALAAITG
ncbi:MAG: beta-ketoacyl-[acyl-carrier-protein] synthase family protein, partial [Mucilaginibacter sp.]